MSDEDRDDDLLPAARSTYVGSKPDRSYCPHCQHVLRPFYMRCPRCEGDRNRERVDALADVIRELKGSLERPLSPDRERELVKLLRDYDHPDADGFLRWLQESRERPVATKRRNRA